MNKEDIIAYIKSNINQIYHNFYDVFELDISQVDTLIINLIKTFKYNRKLSNKEYSTNIFSINNLSKIKEQLFQIGLSYDEIKKVIVKSPMIILYSEKLDYVYYLYKNRKYYGYIVLDSEGYDTYLFNDNLNSNVISNNYIVEQMLKYYNASSYDKETFDNMECDFKLKNYYLKRKKK